MNQDIVKMKLVGHKSFVVNIILDLILLVLCFISFLYVPYSGVLLLIFFGGPLALITPFMIYDYFRTKKILERKLHKFSETIDKDLKFIVNYEFLLTNLLSPGRMYFKVDKLDIISNDATEAEVLDIYERLSEQGIITITNKNVFGFKIKGKFITDKDIIMYRRIFTYGILIFFIGLFIIMVGFFALVLEYNEMM